MKPTTSDSRERTGSASRAAGRCRRRTPSCHEEGCEGGREAVESTRPGSVGLRSFFIRIVLGALIAGLGVTLLVCLRAWDVPMPICVSSLLACVACSSALICYAVFMVALERRAGRREKIERRKRWAAIISACVGLLVLSPLIPIVLSASGIPSALYVSALAATIFLIVAALAWGIYRFIVA